MNVRPFVAAAAVAVCAAVTPSSAAVSRAAVGPEVSDAKGDANAANRQGVLTTGPDGQATDPVSYAAADIVSVDWISTFSTTVKKVRGKKVTVKTPTGFKTALTLAGAPANAIVYRIESASPFCESFWLEYRVAPDNSAKTTARCAADGSVWEVPAAVVSGNTITWTVPISIVKPLKAKHAITDLGAQTRGFVWFAGQSVDVPLLGRTSGLTVPQFDHAFAEDAVYKVGA